MSDSPPPAEDDAPGVPEWVVTYGDMMSLLLTFFIMLVSMSELKQDGKMRAMLDSIREQFGPTVGQAGVPGKSPQELSDQTFASSRGMKSEGAVSPSSRNSAGASGPNLPVERLSHQQVITLGGPIGFEPFSAEIDETSADRIRRLAELLVSRNLMVMVRGHASPEPLPEDNEYTDPMDLSFARARAVCDLLIASGLPTERVLVSAAGASEPRTRSRVTDDQVWNRRVDIFLTDSYIAAPETSGSTDSDPNGSGSD